MPTPLLTLRFALLVALLLLLNPLRLSAQSSVASIQLNPALSREYLVTMPTSPLPSILDPGWLKRAASRELARLSLAAASTDSALLPVQQPGQRNRSWIGRHPVLFGILVGLGGGYLVGVGAGADGIFDDFTAGENGLFVAGIGAGTGALAGVIVGAATK